MKFPIQFIQVSLFLNIQINKILLKNRLKYLKISYLEVNSDQYLLIIHLLINLLCLIRFFVWQIGGRFQIRLYKKKVTYQYYKI